MESQRLPTIDSSAGDALVEQIAKRVNNMAKGSTSLALEIRELVLETKLLSDELIVSGIPEADSEDLLQFSVRLVSVLGVPDL